MSQEKKSGDYTSGTYFIPPKLIEEMRQAQRQKRQLARKQGGVPTEQHASPTPPNTLDAADKQTTTIAPDPTGTQSGPINTAHIQPTQN